MNRQTIFNLASNIIAMIVSLGISFILTPFLIGSVGKEAYSFFPIANSIVNYITIITMALNSMVSRFITIEIVKNNDKIAKEYFSSVFLSNCTLSIILVIPLLIIVISLEKLMDIPLEIVSDIKIMFVLVFAAMLINVFTSMFGVAVYAKNRMDLKAENEIFQGILKGVLYYAFFNLFAPNMIYIGITVFLLSISNLIVQIILTRKLLPQYVVSIKLFKFNRIKELLSSGIWNSINSLGMSLLLGASLVIANMRIGSMATGDLAIIQTLPSFMTTIITTVYTVFLPQITRSYAAGSKEKFLFEIQGSQKILSVLSTVPVLMIILFGENFYSLWVPGENPEYLQKLTIITIAPLYIHANMWTLYCLNIVLNKIKIPCFVLIGIGIINIAITNILLVYSKNVIIIPLVSSVLSILYYLFFIPVYASKQLKIKKGVFYNYIVKTTFFSIVFGIIVLGIKTNIVINSWTSFFVIAGIIGIIGVIIHGSISFTKKELNIIFKSRGL